MKIHPLIRLPLYSLLIAFILLCSPLLFAETKTETETEIQIEVQVLFDNQAMLKINGHSRLLKQGKPSPEGVLLLEANSERVVLRIKQQIKEYHLDNRISTRYSDSKPTQKVVKIAANGGGMYISSGWINGYPVHFLVDTGASSVAMSAPQARRLGIDYRKGKPTRVSTANGIAKAYIVTLDSVQIGNISLSRVEAFVNAGNYPREILLGMSFLNHLDIKQSNRMMELRTR